MGSKPRRNSPQIIWRHTSMFDSLNSTGTLRIDGEGRLMELAPWSDQQAAAIAREEGLELTPEHLMILKTLRTQFSTQRPAVGTRDSAPYGRPGCRSGWQAVSLSVVSQWPGPAGLPYRRPTDPQRQQQPFLRQCDVSGSRKPCCDRWHSGTQQGAARGFKPRSTPAHYRPDHDRTGRDALSGCA